MTKLQELREAIIRVVPKMTAYRITGYKPDGTLLVDHSLPIQLADVILAVDRTPSRERYKNFQRWASFEISFYLRIFHSRKFKWDLTKPLEQQSDEVIQFLHGVICQK